MSQLIETRWKRYGKDRVYVKTVEGNDVGHVDLVERTVVAKIADYEAELRECLARWTSGMESAAEEEESMAPTPPPIESEVEAALPETEPSISVMSASDDGGRDLAANVAGAAARAKRNEVNAQVAAMPSRSR